jgi:hypothetical protein
MKERDGLECEVEGVTTYTNEMMNLSTLLSNEVVIDSA